jgi:hypothetical protein
VGEVDELQLRRALHDAALHDPDVRVVQTKIAGQREDRHISC